VVSVAGVLSLGLSLYLSLPSASVALQKRKHMTKIMKKTQNANLRHSLPCMVTGFPIMGFKNPTAAMPKGLSLEPGLTQSPVTLEN